MNPVNISPILLSDGHFMDVYPNGDYTIYNSDPTRSDWDGNLTAFDSGRGPVNYQAAAALQLRHQRSGHDAIPVADRAVARDTQLQRGISMGQGAGRPVLRASDRHLTGSENSQQISAGQVFSNIANRVLTRNQIAYEIEFQSFTISHTLATVGRFGRQSEDTAKIKLKLLFSGIFELQNVNNHPDFRLVLNEGVVEQRVEGHITQLVTREFTTSWEDLVLQRVYRAFGVGYDEATGDGFDLESTLANAVTIPRILQGERNNLEWNFTPNAGMSFIPPSLSLYVMSTRRQFIDHSFGSRNIAGIPIELRFNGGLVINFGLSAGGWRWVLTKMIRQMGWEPAIIAFKQRLRSSAISVLRASPIPLISLAIGLAVAYGLAEVTRAARVRGYHEGLAMAYSQGFTRTVWIERNFETRARGESRRTRQAYEKGVQDAVRILNVLSLDESQNEVAKAARNFRNHLRRAFSLNVDAERSQVAFSLAQRISAGGSIPNPSANLPY